MFKKIVQWFKDMGKVTMPEPYKEEPIAINKEKKVRKPRIKKEKPLVETVIPPTKKVKKVKK